MVNTTLSIGYSVSPPKRNADGILEDINPEYYLGRPYEYEVMSSFFDKDNKSNNLIELNLRTFDNFLRNVAHFINMLKKITYRKDKVPISENLYITTKNLKKGDSGVDLFVIIANRENNQKLHHFTEGELVSLLMQAPLIKTKMDLLASQQPKMKTFYAYYLQTCCQQKRFGVVSPKEVEGKLPVEFLRQFHSSEDLFVQIHQIFASVV